MEGIVSVAAPKNTMMYQRKGRPLTLKRDITSASIVDVAAKVRAFGAEHGSSAKPETEAIMFYLANHAMKELEFRFDPEEPLPDWAVGICDTYHSTAARIATRAFYYLLLITAREARHNHKKNEPNWKAKITNQFGNAPMMGLLNYPDNNDIAAVTKVFDTHAPTADLGSICRSIVYTFYEGSFSGGYGGKKWGVVADCMNAYVEGSYTAEMMLDTVWTLCHNGGPIFNKGMLYQCHDQALQMVLDVQRAGQIPRMVLTPTGNHKVHAESYIGPEAKLFAQHVADHLDGGDFVQGVPVDWVQVKALGAIGNYSHLVGSQPAPKPYVSPPIAAAEKPTEKTHYIIANAPGLMFKKITRKEVHAA